jgi:hypothetical protein
MLVYLFAALIGALVIAAMFTSSLAFYESTSHKGTLIGTEISHVKGSSTTFVVKEVFSYGTLNPKSKHAHKCYRVAFTRSSESSAKTTATEIVLGTKRTLYLSVPEGDHRCIDKKTRIIHLNVVICMYVFIAAWICSAIWYVWSGRQHKVAAANNPNSAQSRAAAEVAGDDSAIDRYYGSDIDGYNYSAPSSTPGSAKVISAITQSRLMELPVRDNTMLV